MGITTSQAERLHSGSTKVYGSGGALLGHLGQIYIEEDTQNPAWATIQTGWGGPAESFVWLRNARIEGSDLFVPTTPNSW